VVSGPTTTRTLSITVCKGAVVTVDRLVADEVEEDLDAVLGSADTELGDLAVTFADESPVGHALCDSSGMVWQVKLETIVDVTEGTRDTAGKPLLIHNR
jgi:hypothetical protein